MADHVPPGYKKTEIGVIPEDWEVKKLEEIFEIKRGASPRPIEKYTTNKSDGINWIKISDVSPNDKYLIKTEVKITHDGAEHSVYVYPGDLILSNSMSYGRPYISKIKGCIHDGWLLLKQKTQLYLEFFYYLLSSSRVKKDFDLMAAGSGVNNLKIDSVKKLSVQMPPLPEQRAIARVLSDIDALIENLDKLIEKKKNIKKGAMQQLLTGKKRLPGFEGEWVRKKLGEIGYCQSGNGFPLKYQNLKTGEYPFFKVADLSGKGNNIFLKFPNHWITEDIRRKIGAFVFPQNAIIFAKIGAAIFLERKRILFQNSCIDNNMMGFITTSSEIDYRFIYYIFNTLSLSRLVESTALPSISKNNIENLEISIPPTLEEQRAIAQILSDMDAEIEALERKKEKYEMIKKGMMELLLTGKVRVKEENGEIRRV